MNVKSIIEILAATAMLVGLLGVLFERIKSGRGIGARTIQFAGAAMLIPSILILSLEGIFEKQTIGAIIGAAIGYLLSGVNESDEPRPPTAR